MFSTQNQRVRLHCQLVIYSQNSSRHKCWQNCAASWCWIIFHCMKTSSSLGWQIQKISVSLNTFTTFSCVYCSFTYCNVSVAQWLICCILLIVILQCLMSQEIHASSVWGWVSVCLSLSACLPACLIVVFNSEVFLENKVDVNTKKTISQQLK